MRFGFFKKPEVKTAEKSGVDSPKLQQTSTASTSNGHFNEEELKSLRRFADEQIKKDLESALGVAAVKISGGLEDEIQVLIDQARLAQLKLPVEEISRLLGAENVNLSGGRLEEGIQQYLVRTLNQFRSVEEFGSVIVAHRDGAPVYLRDVAIVRHGFKEREAITRINGIEGVEVAIYKEGDANTVSVARAVEKRLDEVRKDLPIGLELVKVYDQSTFITQAVDDVISAGWQGGFLAIIILYFFLRNFAATTIIALSIPVSVIATFNLMLPDAQYHVARWHRARHRHVGR
jgi:HAE1 family hydrophobic/amphiphilic exporter-1